MRLTRFLKATSKFSVKSPLQRHMMIHQIVQEVYELGFKATTKFTDAELDNLRDCFFGQISTEQKTSNDDDKGGIQNQAKASSHLQ